jgi:hypothetical protein
LLLCSVRAKLRDVSHQTAAPVGGTNRSMNICCAMGKASGA